MEKKIMFVWRVRLLALCARKTVWHWVSMRLRWVESASLRDAGIGVETCVPTLRYAWCGVIEGQPLPRLFGLWCLGLPEPRSDYRAILQFMTQVMMSLVVAAGGGDLHANGGHAGADVGGTLGGLAAGGELVVVDAVEGAGVLRREVGHDDVGAGGDGALAALRMQGAEGRGGGQQHVGMDDADDGQQAQGELDAAGGPVLEGCAGGGYEGAYADHLGPEGVDELEVLHECGDALTRRADHEAGSHLEAQVAQVGETLHAVVEAHLGGVEPGVVVAVGGLVAQQVAVGAGLFESREALAAALAEREGDGTVGEA